MNENHLLSALMVTSHEKGINWGRRQGHKA
jgi:hypothetical protein